MSKSGEPRLAEIRQQFVLNRLGFLSIEATDAIGWLLGELDRERAAAHARSARTTRNGYGR